MYKLTGVRRTEICWTELQKLEKRNKLCKKKTGFNFVLSSIRRCSSCEGFQSSLRYEGAAYFLTCIVIEFISASELSRWRISKCRIACS